MSDIDRGRAQTIVQRSQLAAHDVAELGIERTERLVHQEGGWPAHDRAAERDPLAIAARQSGDRPVEKMFDAQDAGRLLDAAPDLGPRPCPRT